MDDKTLQVEVRLEDKELPRDRISRIIWLHADEIEPSKTPAADPKAAPSSLVTTTRVQAVRSDGIAADVRRRPVSPTASSRARATCWALAASASATWTSS